MIKECYFVGAPSQFSSVLSVFPPTVNIVASNPQFWQCYKLLTLSQEEIEDELINKDENIKQIPSPLEFLLINCYHNPQYAELAKLAFRLFCHTDIEFVYDVKRILIGNAKEEVLKATTLDDLNFLDERSFFAFQNEIRSSMGEKPIEPPNPNEDPRVKKIKAKARYRDRVKAKQGIGLQLVTCLASICCMNMGLNPLNIGEISYASVHTLMTTYQEKEKYDIDVRSLQAGADPKKLKPTYWIRNLD